MASLTWDTLLRDSSHCSVIVHNCSTTVHNCSATHHGGRTMSLTTQLCSHLLGQAQDSVAQRVQGARGLSGHTSPCGECVGFILEDSAPPEVEEDYLPFLWLDSKWSHLVHYDEIFGFELELLTPLWQVVLGLHCSATVHTARRWLMLLGDGSHC